MSLNVELLNQGGNQNSDRVIASASVTCSTWSRKELDMFNDSGIKLAYIVISSCIHRRFRQGQGESSDLNRMLISGEAV